MNRPQESHKRLSGEEIATALTELGEEVTAERIVQLEASLATRELPAGSDRETIREAVEIARRRIDAAAPLEPGLIEQPESRYLARIRLLDGTTDYWECKATNDFDARQKAGWAFLHKGTVTSVSVIEEETKPSSPIEIGTDMYARVNAEIGYCPVKIIRDVTDDASFTTPRAPGEKVFEVLYTSGDFKGQYVPFAAHDIRDSYPEPDPAPVRNDQPLPGEVLAETRTAIRGAVDYLAQQATSPSLIRPERARIASSIQELVLLGDEESADTYLDSLQGAHDVVNALFATTRTAEGRMAVGVVNDLRVVMTVIAHGMDAAPNHVPLRRRDRTAVIEQANEKIESLSAALAEVGRCLDGLGEPIRRSTVDGNNVDYVTRARYVAEVALGARDAYTERDVEADTSPAMDL